MKNVPCSVYRSMIRYSLKKDPQVKLHMRTGLMTLKERRYPKYSFTYYENNNVNVIFSPYFNETTSLLSYTKHLIRINDSSKFYIERLFYAHRQLPNFIKASKKLQEQEKQELIKKNKSSSFGTSFY